MSKIIVTRIKNRIITTRFDGFNLERISIADTDKESIIGNIYIAKVKNIVKNINAAFVEIANGQMCYLELRDNVTPIFMNLKKDNVIKVGDEILVEVTKEAHQKKDPVVTTSIGIKSDNIILTHGKNYVGVSNKITDDTCRKNIQDILNNYVTEEYGFIVRTKAADSIDRLETEAVDLANRYNELIKKAKFLTCFSCVYKNMPSYICDIKEMCNKSVEEIVIEDDKLFADVSSILTDNGLNNIKLRHYSDDTLSLDKLYSIESNIASLLKEKVWLKSGGNIIIQHTDALTAIDVNTSKAINIKGENEKTFYKVNLEAAKEIARQISLRNIGGIIIIDFINMKDKAHISQLLESFSSYLEQDYVKSNVVDITKLNLVEVTRQKIKQPLSKYIYEGFLENK